MECVHYMVEWVYGNEPHCINLFNHYLHYNVLVFDVYDGCHGFSLGSHEGRSKDHAQITCLHQILIRVGGNTESGIT